MYFINYLHVSIPLCYMKDSTSYSELHAIFTSQHAAVSNDSLFLSHPSIWRRTALLSVDLSSLLTLFSPLAPAPACLLLSSYHTSICSIKLDAKDPLGSTGVVTCSEDYPTDGFVFPDHAGDGRRGHYPMVSDDQATHLRKCHAGAFVSWLSCLCV